MAKNKDENKNLFAERLQYVIKEKGIKPVEISQKTGINKAQISRWLSGKFIAKQNYVYELAKYLDVSPYWLMGYDIPMNEKEEVTKKKSMFRSTLINLMNYYCIKQEQLSKEINIPLKRLSDFMNEEDSPNKEEMKSICDFFGIEKEEDLFNGNTLGYILFKNRELSLQIIDKQKLAYAIEQVFEKLSNDLNEPLDNIRSFFLKRNNEIYTSFDEIYDLMKNEYINYIKLKTKLLDKQKERLDVVSNLSDKEWELVSKYIELIKQK